MRTGQSTSYGSGASTVSAPGTSASSGTPSASPPLHSNAAYRSSPLVTATDDNQSDAEADELPRPPGRTLPAKLGVRLQREQIDNAKQSSASSTQPSEATSSKPSKANSSSRPPAVSSQSSAALPLELQDGMDLIGDAMDAPDFSPQPGNPSVSQRSSPAEAPSSSKENAGPSKARSISNPRFIDTTGRGSCAQSTGPRQGGQSSSRQNAGPSRGRMLDIPGMFGKSERDRQDRSTSSRQEGLSSKQLSSADAAPAMKKRSKTGHISSSNPSPAKKRSKLNETASAASSPSAGNASSPGSNESGPAADRTANSSVERASSMGHSSPDPDNELSIIGSAVPKRRTSSKRRSKFAEVTNENGETESVRISSFTGRPVQKYTQHKPRGPRGPYKSSDGSLLRPLSSLTNSGRNYRYKISTGQAERTPPWLLPSTAGPPTFPIVQSYVRSRKPVKIFQLERLVATQPSRAKEDSPAVEGEGASTTLASLRPPVVTLDQLDPNSAPWQATISSVKVPTRLGALPSNATWAAKGYYGALLRDQWTRREANASGGRILDLRKLWTRAVGRDQLQQQAKKGSLEQVAQVDPSTTAPRASASRKSKGRSARGDQVKEKESVLFLKRNLPTKT